MVAITAAAVVVADASMTKVLDPSALVDIELRNLDPGDVNILIAVEEGWFKDEIRSTFVC